MKNRWCALLASTLLAAPWALGQADPGDDAKAWLAILDGRIYSPPALDAVSFRFRPQIAGPDGTAVLAPYAVAYRWRRDHGDRADLVEAESVAGEARPLTELPGHTSDQFQKVRDDFRQVARNLRRILQGMTLSEQYSQWSGRVRRERINGAEEITLVFEPAEGRASSRAGFVRVTMHLDRSRVPWRLEKVHLNGDRYAQHHTYETLDERLVITKVTRTHTPKDPRDPAFDQADLLRWQRVEGILLLASIERLGNDLPALVRGRTEFLDLRVNASVGAFEAEPEVPAEGGPR